MPKTDLLDISGKKVGIINLPPEIFAAEVNPQLMAQAVRVYLANQRKAHPKTKTRSEVNRTKAKWYPQKGTGRARHGSRAAPIFVGGGVAHGPTGEQNYQLKMPKKMKKVALFSALTSKFKEKEILVVKGLEKIEPKTKKMAEIIKKFKIQNSKFKILLILPKVLKNIVLAGRNLENLEITQASDLNTYQVLNSDRLIFLPESIDRLKEVFLKK
jgi:large subunit ribosomal protein L4